MKTLGENFNIHITKPDKGNGLVILNKDDYFNKLESILNDPTIFQNCMHDDPFTYKS